MRSEVVGNVFDLHAHYPGHESVDIKIIILIASNNTKSLYFFLFDPSYFRIFSMCVHHMRLWVYVGLFKHKG